MEEIMRFKLDRNYSDKEIEFIKENNCEILDELKLSKTDFQSGELPLRAIKYGGAYICKVSETSEPAWAELTKFRGVFCFSNYYDSLKTVKENL